MTNTVFYAFSFTFLSIGIIFLAAAMVLMNRSLHSTWEIIRNLEALSETGLQISIRVFENLELLSKSQFKGKDSENAESSGQIES